MQQVTWVLLAYDKSSDRLESEVPLPESVDDNVVRSLVGNHPNLRGDSFSVVGESLSTLSDYHFVDVRESDLNYFIEWRQT